MSEPRGQNRVQKTGGDTIGTINGCAKTFRSNIKKRLKRDLNLICEEHDVLVRDEQGYHLNDDKITLRDGTDDGAIGTLKFCANLGILTRGFQASPITVGFQHPGNIFHR